MTMELKGRKFFRLTAIERVRRNRTTFYRCLCACGTEKLVRSQSLLNGDTRSCGCLRSDKMRREKTRHAHYRSPTYNSYRSMLARCKPTHRQYKDYGGRGISICSRWLESFENFLADMGERPAGKTLDREKNDGNYEPGNCRWATRLEQNRNKRKHI